MRRFIFAAAVAAAATLALAASASADVARYQLQHATLTANVNNGAYIHEYGVKISPCDGLSFVGTGGVETIPDLGEVVSGTLVGSTLTFHSSYKGGTYNPTYEWNYTGPLSGGAADAGVFNVVWTLALGETTTYRNHGEYVTDMGGGADAAHSCIGKPMEYSFTESGIIPATSADGVSVTLPDSGTYRIDVSGTWTNAPYGPVDAEFTSLVDPWVTYEDGFEHSPYLLGEGFGDVQVNGQFVNWGAYNASHVYTLFASLSGPEVVLSIFDGDSNTNTVMPWYGDNTGSLNYTITYVGP